MFIECLKGNQQLVSIEHNGEWYDKVNRALIDHRNRKNTAYLFVPSEIDIKFYGYGFPSEENPCYNMQYINPETASNRVSIFDADIYLVDGISRGACLATIFSKARKRENVQVYVHDYVGRQQWYEWACALFPRKELVGRTLCKLGF